MAEGGLGLLFLPGVSVCLPPSRFALPQRALDGSNLLLCLAELFSELVSVLSSTMSLGFDLVDFSPESAPQYGRRNRLRSLLLRLGQGLRRPQARLALEEGGEELGQMRVSRALVRLDHADEQLLGLLGVPEPLGRGIR